MKLQIVKYSILKLGKVYKYQVTLKALNQDNVLHYISSGEFLSVMACNSKIKLHQEKNTYYEIRYGKVVEVESDKFSNFYDKLIKYFAICSIGQATTNDWLKMKKNIVVLFNSNEITKEEMNSLNDKVTFHFKNQNRALELSLFLEKIKEKRAS